MKPAQPKAHKNKISQEEMQTLFGVQNLELIPDPASKETDSIPDTTEKFLQTTQTLWEELKITYYWSKRFNLHSPNYLKAAKRLKKIIEKLGSAIITLAALEQLGYSYPEFDELTIYELQCVASLNFRKTNAALDDLDFDMSDEYFTLANLLLDWSNLLMRLEATQLEINQIRDGSIDVREMMKTEEASRRNMKRAQRR